MKLQGYKLQKAENINMGMAEYRVSTEKEDWRQNTREHDISHVKENELHEGYPFIHPFFRYLLNVSVYYVQALEIPPSTR